MAHAYSALKGREPVLFAKLFGAVLVLAVNARTAVARELQEQSSTTRLTFETEALVDLFDLSGYALLYGELLDMDTWRTVCDRWDAFLASASNREEFVKWLGAVATFREQLFMIAPRDQSRAQWEIEFSSLLRGMGLLGQYDVFAPKSAVATSRYIEALGSMEFITYRARDFFFLEYLFKRVELSGTTLPRHASDLRNQLKKITARRSKSRG